MDPSAVEIAKITSLADLLDWIGIEDNGTRLVRTSVLRALGGPKLIRQLVAVPSALYEKTTAALKIGITGGAAEDPTPLEVGQMGELRRVARVFLGLAPEASTLAPPPGSGPGSSASAPSSGITLGEMTKALKEAVRPSGRKILASQVMDQCDGSEVVPLDAKILRDLTDEWKVLYNEGEEPTEEEEATAEQLAALNSRILTGATPYVDFGVWRPYGARMGRAMKFVAHIQQADGSTLPKEISGPSNVVWWKKCWKVYAYAMTVLKHASATRLQRYADRIVGLAEEFPAYWWIVALADIKMRSEGLERVRRDCAKRAADGTLKDYDPNRPWDIVYREAATSDFWTKEVDKQITSLVNGLTSVAKVQDAGFGAIIEVDHAVGKKGGRTQAVDSDGSNDAPSKKKSKRTARGQRERQRPPPPQKQLAPPPAKAAGKGTIVNLVNIDLADKKTTEGKYLRDAAGLQLCWPFNQGKNCQTPCRTGRAHKCEWCREVHPSSKCHRQR